MKSLFLTLLAALTATAALSSIIKSQKSIKLVPGKTYVYDYQGRLFAGIPQLADQYAGFEYKADLILQPVDQNVVAMKLDNVRVAKYNKRTYNNIKDDILVEYQPIEAEYERELTKPVRFIYQNGKVKAFEADESEKEWSLNIKKSILSLFNLNLDPKNIINTKKQPQTNRIEIQNQELTVYPVYEDGIGGICETVYEIQRVPDLKGENRETDFVLNVTKTRNYRNCISEPNFSKDNFDVRGCPWQCRKEKAYPAVDGYYPTPDTSDAYISGCPCGHEPHESPVDSYNFVKYNISLHQPQPVIENVYSEGKVSYKNYGDEFLVIVHQNITLKDMVSQYEQIENVQNSKQHLELSYQMPEQTQQQNAPLEVPFMHLFGEPNVEEMTELIPTLLDSLASDIISGEAVNQKDSLQKTVQIVNALSVLPKAALEQLFVEVAQPGRHQQATQKQQIVRKLFLDALPLCGTNYAAKFIKELIENNKVTIMEAKELIEAVPQNLYLPEMSTIDAYYTLSKNQQILARRHLAASVGIAFGKMVKEACVKRQNVNQWTDENEIYHPLKRLVKKMKINSYETSEEENASQQIKSSHERVRRSEEQRDEQYQNICNNEEIEKYIREIAQQIDNAQSFHRKVTLIETLAHTGLPQALKYLQPYISGRVQESKCPGYQTERQYHQTEECDFIRQVTIYTLSHIAEYYPKQVALLVRPVYSDPSQPYEVRIAAFTILMQSAPEKQHLERIASDLHRENNLQVKSYVASTLKQMGNYSIPCFAKIAQYAKQAYQHAPVDAEMGMQYSKMYGADYYQNDRDFGLYASAEYIASNVSQYPRAGYLNIGQNNGPYQDELVQIGFNAKGLDQMIEEILEPQGLLSDVFEGIKKNEKRQKRDTESVKDILKSLKEKMDFEYRTDNEPKATIFFKLFDRTSYFAFDKQYIHQLFNEVEDYVKEQAQRLLQGKTIHYVKMLMPSQMYKVVPSELGLPVVITHRHPIILSLKIDNAKVNFEANSRSAYPTAANVTALVHPTVLYNSYSFIFAINPAGQETYGAHTQKISQFSAPLEVTFGFAKNVFTWSVIPKLPHQIVYHKTEAKTFISQAQYVNAPDRDWLDNAEIIRTQEVPFQKEERYGHEELGLGLHFYLKSEDAFYNKPFYHSKTAQEKGYFAALVEAFRNPGLKPREFFVELEADEEIPTYGYDFTLKYKTNAYVDAENENEEDDESNSSESNSSITSEESNESVSTSRKMKGMGKSSIEARKIKKTRIAKQSAEKQSSSSESDSSSSSQSNSMEDFVFDYDNVMQMIMGQNYQKKNIKKSAKHLITKTKAAWQWAWADEDWTSTHLNSQDEVAAPAVIAHDIAFTAVARGPRPTFYAAKVLYVHSYDYRTMWVKADAHIKSPIGTYSRVPTLFCSDIVFAYPPVPGEFYYEPITMQSQKAKIQAQLGWGAQCQNEGGIIVTGVMEKTEDQVIKSEDLALEEGKTAEDMKNWYYRQCEIDRSEGKPLSYACEKAIVDDSYFNQITLDVQYKNIPREMLNFTSKLDLAMKYALYQYMDNNNIEVNNPEDQLRFVIQYSSRIPGVNKANIQIRKPTENTIYEKINVPYIKPISSLLPTSRVYKSLLTGYDKVDSCAVMEKYIRTFDNVTYEMPSTLCHYLVAKDCSPKEKFAVFAKILDREAKTKSVDVYVAGVEINIIPLNENHNLYQVVVDGQTYELTYQHSLVVGPRNDIRIYLRKPVSEAVNPIVVVEAVYEHVTVLYDGINIKVLVGGKYQGKTCGICGDNNNESEEEFKGPAKCIYEKAKDFANSYALTNQYCQQRPAIEGQKRCREITTSEEEDQAAIVRKINAIKEPNARKTIIKSQIHRRQHHEQQSQEKIHKSQRRQAAEIREQEDGQRMQTRYMLRENMICFTTKPVLTCLRGLPRQTEEKELTFHCLPKESQFTQHLMRLADQGVIKQLANKRVDITQMVAVPIAC